MSSKITPANTYIVVLMRRGADGPDGGRLVRAAAADRPRGGGLSIAAIKATLVVLIFMHACTARGSRGA